MKDRFAKLTLGVCASLAAAVSVLGGDSNSGVGGAMAPVEWKSGPVALARQSSEQKLVAIKEAIAAEETHLFVQFDRIPTRAERQNLASVGLNLCSSVGGSAYFAAISTTSLDATAIVTDGNLGIVSRVDLAWKAHSSILAGELPEWAVVTAPKVRDDGTVTETIVAVCVMFHRDVPLFPDADQVCHEIGAVVQSRISAANALIVELPLSRVLPLAADDRVQWVEPPLPKFEEMADSMRQLVGVDTVRQAPYGLDGDGVTVLVYDGGSIADAHRDFSGRAVIGDHSPLSGHATHVAGILAGDGTVSGGTYAGVAPKAKIISYGFEQENGLRQGFLYSDPGDLEVDYSEAIEEYGAVIANNSIGTSISSNNSPCEWMGDYSVTDAVVDNIIRGDWDTGVPMRVVWSAGRERESTRCQDPPGNPYHSIAPPACGKNEITVGAINSNDDSMTKFSGWGPSDDGRLKPDVVAPGCQTNDDKGVTSCATDGNYAVRCGSSMAAPVVAGLGVLLLEDWRNQYPDQPDFSNAFLKALLAHTAQDLGNTGPDYQNGWGSVRAPVAVDRLRAGTFVESSVDQDDAYSTVIVVPENTGELRVTVAWDDPAAAPNTVPNLINDLDVRITDGNQNVFYPWTLDPADPSAVAVRTQPDHTNNVEQVFLSAPAPGTYRVEVYGFSVAEGPQLFSLVASAPLRECTRQGLLRFTQPTFSCESLAELEVIDCDLNQNEDKIDTATLHASSPSEPNGEEVVVTETGKSTGRFLGTIALSTTNRAGVLKVANGEKVTAEYKDADDGTEHSVTVKQTASIDCVSPAVQSVVVSDVGPFSARVSVQTDEPTRATVLVSTECGHQTNDNTDRRVTTQHAITLTNLKENTKYYFAVLVEDAAGNATFTNDGGECFTFSTPDVVNYFTEQLRGDFDLSGKALSLSPTDGSDKYAGCLFQISTFPTDPSGGEALEVEDDAPIKLTLRDNKQVSLYGISYAEIFVGPNGYITFGAGDSENTPSLAAHFDTPRIAASFTDLDGRNQGTIGWRQLEDRVAVTWENVPEFNTNNSNNFQIELFFDGNIRMSWLQVDATTLITGVSAGNGVPNPFFESDLAALPGCGPLPPSASKANFTTPRGALLTISLTATDDGLPNPPGELSYVIHSLPQFDLFDAGNDYLINPGDLPYTLVNNGNRVRYQPNATFVGLDEFRFLADDSGAPPDGGESNVASIGIEVGGRQLYYRFDLSSDPGWKHDGRWEYGEPMGEGSYNRDPTAGFTGRSVFGYNLSGDYTNNLDDVQYLTTTAIDCTDMRSTQLRFRRWLGIESSTWDQANVDVSNDGKTWTTIWEHTGNAIAERTWSLQTYDVAAIADGNARVYVRWGIGPTDFAVTYPGWNIDDIELWAEPTDTLGDLNCDTRIDFLDIDPFVIALSNLDEYRRQFPDCNPYLGDLNSDGSVNFLDIDPFVELLSK